jgi:hypothetical protein
METRNLTLGLFLAATLTAGSALLFAACSSSSSPAGPTSHEGGTDDGSSGGPQGPACNDASTPQQDPYNACTQYVGNCIPFTRTVPQHPTL